MNFELFLAYQVLLGYKTTYSGLYMTTIGKKTSDLCLFWLSKYCSIKARPYFVKVYVYQTNILAFFWTSSAPGISKSELFLSEGVWADQPMLKVVGWSIPNFYGLWGLREVLVFGPKRAGPNVDFAKIIGFGMVPHFA